MKPRQPLAPAKARARHQSRSCPNTFAPADTSALPPLATDGDGAEEDATDAWLAHIQAGLIAVR